MDKVLWPEAVPVAVALRLHQWNHCHLHSSRHSCCSWQSRHCDATSRHYWCSTWRWLWRCSSHSADARSSLTWHCLPVAVVSPDDVVVAVSHHPFGIHQWAAAHRRSDAAIHRHWNVCDSDESFPSIAGHSCCHWPGIRTRTRHGINIYICQIKLSHSNLCVITAGISSSSSRSGTALLLSMLFPSIASMSEPAPASDVTDIERCKPSLLTFLKSFQRSLAVRSAELIRKCDRDKYKNKYNK